MSDLKFSEDHEWIRVEGDSGVVGLTNFAQEQLGDIVFVDLPEVGRQLAKGDEAAVIESVKAASELYAIVGGEVTEVNEGLGDDPAQVNSDPMGAGLFFKIKIGDAGELDGLMDENAYKEFTASLE